MSEKRRGRDGFGLEAAGRDPNDADESLGEVLDGDGPAVGLADETRAVRGQAEQARRRAGQGRRLAAQQRAQAAEQRRAAARLREQAAAGRERTARVRDEWARRHPLASGFAALSRRLFTAEDLPGVIREVVAATPRLVPGTDLASVTVVGADGRFRTPAHTDPVALALDDAQYQAGAGPCLDATRTGGIGIARCDDLGGDPPWPRFAAAAVRLGMRGVIAIGLFPDSDPPRLGALNLYARHPDRLADADLDVATVLAAHLATALVVAHQAEQERERAVNLRAALHTRDVIGQAKGILMARGGLTADEAFEVLSRASQRLNTKLHEVAEKIIQDPAADL